MNHDQLLNLAFLQALLATNFKLPQKDKGTLILISIAEDIMRLEFLDSLFLLVGMGYQLAGTPGTAEFYARYGIRLLSLPKPPDPLILGPGVDTVMSCMHRRCIDLIINIPEGSIRRDEITAGYLMRRKAVDFGVSLLTNIKCAILFTEALSRNRPLPCLAAEDYFNAPTIG